MDVKRHEVDVSGPFYAYMSRRPDGYLFGEFEEAEGVRRALISGKYPIVSMYDERIDRIEIARSQDKQGYRAYLLEPVLVPGGDLRYAHRRYLWLSNAWVERMDHYFDKIDRYMTRKQDNLAEAEARYRRKYGSPY